MAWPLFRWTKGGHNDPNSAGRGHVDNGQIESRIKKIFMTHLDITDLQYTTKAKVMDDLGAESLDAVDLVLALEEEFDIDITDGQAERTFTVGEVIQLVRGCLAEKAAKGG